MNGFGDVTASETRPRAAFAPHIEKRRPGGAFPISATQDLEAGGLNLAASLLFAPGERPDVRAVLALAQGGSGFTVSLDPNETGAESAEAVAPRHWLELLANGLTYDLSGLAPGAGAELPPGAHCFGLPDGIADEQFQALTLQPGPHLAGGANMLPVVRSLAWLTAHLAALPGVRAVAWHPARCWSAPEQFRASVLGWTDGGAFPAFALAALAPTSDGGMQSEGLALFTCQELRLEPELAEDRAAAGKIGVRLLHWLVEQGKLEKAESLVGPDGKRLRVEPSADGRFVRVWKD